MKLEKETSEMAGDGEKLSFPFDTGLWSSWNILHILQLSSWIVYTENTIKCLIYLSNLFSFYNILIPFH